MRGFLLVDKPSGISSFDVIRKLRKILNFKKMGHAGTLDPLASGLLIIALGEGTKLLQFFVGMDKVYSVTGRFGQVSDSYDADGNLSDHDFTKSVGREEIERIIGQQFFGEIEQLPPKYSALKVNGKRAYDLARSGEEFELKSRDIRINEFKILDYNWPEVSFEVECSTGTYIRSLIHDLGQELDTGAYVSQLRRVSIGEFAVENSIALDDSTSNKTVQSAVVSLESMIKPFAAIDLSEDQWMNLSQGRYLSDVKIPDLQPVFGMLDSKVVALLESVEQGVKMRKMLKPD